MAPGFDFRYVLSVISILVACLNTFWLQKVRSEPTQNVRQGGGKLSRFCG